MRRGSLVQCLRRIAGDGRNGAKAMPPLRDDNLPADQQQAFLENLREKAS